MGWFRKETGVERLVAGYREFRRTTFPRERRRYQNLTVNGQRPKVMLIGCSDSRVSPTTILSAPPGEIFIARNIANIVPPYDPDSKPRSIGAAVEYAIKVLNVSDIIIKGHARCGGVAALVSRGEGLPATDYLKPWVEVADPARALLPANFDSLDPDEKRTASERAVIQNSILNLSAYPWVRDRLEAGTLKIHGWHFDILEGLLHVLDHESGEWRPLK
jgi:carbonic anhydrase